MLLTLLHAALASAAVVGLQVLLPRILSVVLWYHLGFFAVSLAMLGFAYGGRIVRRRAPDPATVGALASAAIVVAVAIVVRLPIVPSELTESAGQALLFFAVAPLLAVPFVLLGTQLCSALDRAKERFAVAYSASFVGGAAGAGAALFLMDRLGAPRALAAIAALPLVASLASRRKEALGPAFAALVVSCAAAIAPSDVLPMRSKKHFPVIPDAAILDEKWNAFSRVTFYENPDRHGLWSMPEFFDRATLPRSIGVAIDSWAITSILERGGAAASAGWVAHYPPTIASVGAAPGFSALVVGAGGGVDVAAALEQGAGSVVAVEINPLIVDAVRGRFDSFCGGLYRDPRVRAVAAEGRAFVDDDKSAYDRIVLTGVDTFAATEAGAFALSENYLYTVEAMRAWLSHLAPNGRLFMSRWWFEPPRQTLKLTLTAVAALEAVGVSDARRRVFVGRAGNNSLFIVKNGEFEAREVDELSAACRARGSEVVYAPDRGGNPAFVTALTPGAQAALIADYPYRIEPPVDDRPFFFENGRGSRLFRTSGDWIHGSFGGQEVLAVTLLALLVLTLPLLLRGRPDSSRPPPLPVASALPFVALGFAYALVEIPLLTRLALPLGHPVYSVSCVLVSLLAMSGVGALLSRRVPAERAMHAAFTAALFVVLVLLVAHEDLIDAVRHASRVERVLGVIAFLALPAIAMGMPLPLAVRRLESTAPSFVPAAFTANAAAAALAGPCAMAIALTWGFAATIACGAACYLLATLALLRAPAASPPV